MKIIGQIPPILLYCLSCLSVLTETIYSAAIPEIADQLHTEGATVQLATTAYYTGFALGILTLGRVSDIYGRRPVVLLGISLYIIATFLLSFSTSIDIFILFRFFQAYGASVGSVIAQSMTRDSYRGWELSSIYSSVAMVAAIVPSIGSAIGGYIIEYYKEWQYIFKFLILLSSSLLIIYTKFLPETNPYIGENDAHDGRFLNVLKAASRDKTLLGYALIVGGYNGVCFGFFIQAPFIFIDKMDMPPSDYGKLFFFLSAANLIGGMFCKYLIRKFVPISKIKAIGFIFSSIGCLLLVVPTFFVNQNSSLLFTIISIFIPIAIHLIGHSLVVPMMLRDAIEAYPKTKGAAGSIFGFLYYMITAIVSFMISAFHSDSINNYAYLFATILILCVITFRLIKSKSDSNY